MKKNYLKILFLLTSIMTGALVTHAYDFEVDGIYYNINGTEATVTKGASYGGYSGSITIPATVTYNSVVYPVTEIGREAFERCRELTHVDIPNSVTLIDSYAFTYCESLTNIEIPNSVISIGNSAFASCDGLTRVNIPSSIETIDWDAFSECWNLERVDITDLEAWLHISFNYMTSNPLCQSGASLYLNDRKIEDLVIPDGVTYINGFTFAGYNVRSVTIPNSVRYIRNNAFLYCGAEKVTIGNGVQRIGQGAFYGGHIRRIISLSETPPVIEVSDYYDEYLPNDCFSSETYSNAYLMVPNSCRSNYQNASYWSNFNNIWGIYDFEVDNIYYKKTSDNTVMVCSDETREYYEGPAYSGNVTVPESVTYKGSMYNVTSVEEYSFCSSDSLIAIVLPNSLESIGYYAFGYCPELKSISLGSGLTTIGSYAFQDCSSINQIKSFALTPPIMANKQVFDDNVYSSATLELPRAAVSLYRSADYWKDFSTIRPIPYDFVVDGIYYLVTSENTVSVSYKDTNYDTYRGNVIIPENVTFDGHSYSVTSIGANSFAFCDELTNVSLPNSIASIGGNAFKSCTALPCITIPNSVFSIENSAFGVCI